MDAMTTDNAGDAARRILDLFGRRAVPGTVLKEGFFLTAFPLDRLTVLDFKSGCNYAKRQGWIEETELGVFMLTKVGFSACH
jgi:hypothetical protein